MKPLPDKPSELIRLALADLEECEKDPDYVIGMGRWHAPENERCVVCLPWPVTEGTLALRATGFADALIRELSQAAPATTTQPEKPNEA